jgi:[ribosomal protein S18]-alanine N-acetyltransferase
MIPIHRMERAQVAAIMPVMTAAFDPQYGEAWNFAQCRDVLAVPGTFLLAAGPADQPVGFALARTVFDQTELLLLAVMPSAQRSGIGAMLLRATADHARATGATSLFVEVRSENSARRFYTQNGFTDIGIRKNYYRNAQGQTADAITMSCILSINTPQ